MKWNKRNDFPDRYSNRKKINCKNEREEIVKTYKTKINKIPDWCPKGQSSLTNVN
jgi:hypothetical protein